MSSTNNQREQEQEQPHFENDFEMVKVSIGFVRSLQDSVLRLERNQQYLIAQLDHANSLVTQYHETSCMYHQKYDQVLHEMEELNRKHEVEIAILFEKIDEANQNTESERALKEIHAEQIELLERQIAQQVDYDFISQARTTNINDNDEILSPVSVASPSPILRSSPRQMHTGFHTSSVYLETHGVTDDDEYHFHNRYRSSQNSQTTDCSGDPICNSDTDSD